MSRKTKLLQNIALIQALLLFTGCATNYHKPYQKVDVPQLESETYKQTSHRVHADNLYYAQRSRGVDVSERDTDPYAKVHFSDYFDVDNPISPFYEPNNSDIWYMPKSITVEGAVIEYLKDDLTSPGMHLAYTMQRLDLPWFLSPAPKLGVVVNFDFEEAMYGYAAFSWNIFLSEDVYINADLGLRAQSRSKNEDYGSVINFHETLGLYYRFNEVKDGFHEIGLGVSHGSHLGWFGDENPGLNTVTFGYRFSFKSDEL